MMDVIALVVAALALVAAYLTLRRAEAHERRISSLESGLASIRAELGQAQRELKTQMSDLNRTLRQQSGELKFEPSMTIAEAMQVHPGVVDVLARFHLNGCPSCAVSDVDTIDGACRSYGIDQNALMSELTKLIQPDAIDLLTMARSTRN
jgi:hybrid cluster-associated redox disulfide protein